MAKQKHEPKSEKMGRKAQQREARRARLEAHAGATRALERRKLAVLGLLPLTAAVAGGAYWGLGDVQLAGVSILVGGLLFLIVGLTLLGASVPPRNRLRSGALDYGQKR